MKQERIIVGERKSEISETTGLVISVKSIDPSNCNVVVGYPGLPNVGKTMETGDVVLLETLQRGVLEARLIEHNYLSSFVEFLVSQVSPRIGLIAGAMETTPNNEPFAPDELHKIRESIATAKERLDTISELEPAQIQLLHRKLDEIQDASARLGRKDWINYVAGTLTSVCVSAALSSEATTRIFKAVDDSFRWLFSTGVLHLN